MPRYEKSDHFDGSHFFNPANPEGNGFRAAAKMFMSIRFRKWPERVENSPALDLQLKLAVDELAVTFVNHATVLVQSRDFTLLTDPVWSERVSPVPWAGPKRHREPGIPFDELPKIDFVLISHNHYDHLDIASLKKLNQKFQPQVFAPLGNRRHLEGQGIKHVVELDWWESATAASGARISLGPAEHFSGRSPFDRNETLWGSFGVSFGAHSIYFAGDTAYSPHFKATRERFGAPDLAFLPIGAYDPRWFMKVVHMNPAEAVQAHLDLGAKQSIGIHFGTFQLTEEAIDQPVKDLEVALNHHGLGARDFSVLGEGRTQIFKLN